MSFYRYACEVTQNNGEIELHRSLIPLPYEDIISNALFTYRYYTSESEKEAAEHCYVVSLGYERRDPHRPLQTTLPYNRYSIHYFMKGKGFYRDAPIRAGQVLFVPPYQHRHFESDPSDPLEFYYVTITGQGSETVINNAGFELSASLSECPFISKIPSLFYPALFESHPDSEPTMYLMGIFLQLMALHKNYNSRSFDVPQEKSFFYYKQALSYIEWYLLQDITPNDVAQYLHISPPYLRKIFAKYCNCSLREFLLQKRIKYAADKLAYSQCTVLAAANEIGYDDYTQFSKIFKKYMGMSPSAYKEAHSSDESEDNNEKK